MPKIFVSHSSKDKKLVDQIILFLESSLNLEGDSIRCSSSTGYSLPSGAQIELSIKSDIEEAELIIGVITNASRTSEWVQAELSAAWGKNKWIVPICAGIQSSKLMEPIKGLKIVRIEVEDDLIELIEKIEERLHLGRKSGSKVTVAARRLIEYFKTESMTQNIGQQFFSKFRQKYKLTKFVMLVGIIALSLALIGGYRLWEFVFKKQIIVGVGPHHTISKDDLKKSYKQRYHTSTLSRYELEFLVLDSYPDMLLDLLRQRVDVALVSPNTWIQFKTDKLLLKDDKGNKVKPADFWVLGQKRQKRGEDEVLKEYYQSCFLFKKGDHVLELAKKQNVSDGHLWNAIDANSIRGRTIFLNEETLSTSTFIIPFISLIEKGIVSDELCNMLEPCSRTGMVFQVTSSQSIGVGALSDEEIEQGRYERDIEKVIIPAKIPYDAVLVTLDKWRNWKETNKESFFREMLHDANLISIAGDQYAYDIFIERIS